MGLHCMRIDKAATIAVGLRVLKQTCGNFGF